MQVCGGREKARAYRRRRERPVVTGARYVVGLALARLRRGGSGALPAALGIAAAAAVLAGVLVGGDRRAGPERGAGRRARFPPTRAPCGRRGSACRPGPTSAGRALDRQATAAARRAPRARAHAVALVRESTVGGRFVGLAAVDGLAPHVLLRSGRLPRTCTAERCEVAAAPGRGRACRTSRGCASSRSGRARSARACCSATSSRRPTTRSPTPSSRPRCAASRVPPAAARAARRRGGRRRARRLARARALVPLLRLGAAARRRHAAALGDRRPRRRRRPGARRARSPAPPSGRSTCPSRSSTRPSGTRPSRDGGCCSSAARRRRSWSRSPCSPPARSGATSPPPAAASRGTAPTAGQRRAAHGDRERRRRLRRRRRSAGSSGRRSAPSPPRVAGAPAVAVLRESVLSPVRPPPRAARRARRGRRRLRDGLARPAAPGRVGALDLAAVVALLAALGILVSGAVDARRARRGRRRARVLLVLPGLDRLRRRGRRGASPAGRRALGGAARRPGRPPRRRLARTLARRGGDRGGVPRARRRRSPASPSRTGRRSRAASATRRPSPCRPTSSCARTSARSSPSCGPPRSSGTARSRASRRCDPVSRVTASAGPAASVSGVTVLGVGRDAVERSRSGATTGACRAALADAVERDGSDALRGPMLPRPGAALAVGPGLLTYLATIRAARRDASARSSSATAEAAPADRAHARRCRRAARGGRLVSLTLRPPRLIDRGADSGVALRGRTTLRMPGVSLDDWIGERRRRPRPRTSRPGALDVRYAVTSQRIARVRPRQPTDASHRRPSSRAALGDLAGGVGGTLPLRIGGETVNVRVAGGGRPDPRDDRRCRGRRPGGARAPPSTPERPARRPCRSSGSTSPTASDAASRPRWRGRPFAVLAKTLARARSRRTRAAIRSRTGRSWRSARPRSSRSSLAVGGLVLAIRADLRDDRGELADLEAQGATPRLLRRTVVRRGRRSSPASVSPAGSSAARSSPCSSRASSR